MNTQVLQGLLVPFLGTTLGAALVFFLKRDLPEKVQKGLSGFAAGVMVAASIWSLLIPALEGAADLGAWSFLPATIGFWLGILFLLLLDRLVPHVHLDGEQEGLRASLPRSMMVALAVALHNLPEGMAVGVVYAGSMQPEQVGSVSFASAFALAVGIALQNVPEGAIVAELYADTAPITVANFLSLVDSGFYDGLTFHRIISGFMIQGGDPNGNGTGGSSQRIKGEFSANGVQNDLKHTRGVLSMARSSAMDSASSQFFIMHADAPHLDGQYAAFGKVISGMEVVDAICEHTPVTDRNGTVAKANQPVIERIIRVEKPEE